MGGGGNFDSCEKSTEPHFSSICGYRDVRTQFKKTKVRISLILTFHRRLFKKSGTSHLILSQLSLTGALSFRCHQSRQIQNKSTTAKK